MSFLSSLFQGSTPQPVAGPAIQSAQLPKELAPYYKDILGKAQALYNERTAEGFQPYQGPTIADFTPEQQQAFTGLQGLVGSQAPVFQEGMDLTRAAAAPMTSEQMTQYMSPYQQAVTDIEKREATKQYESQVVPQLAAQAATTGGFGGSRQAILEGMAADTQQRLLSDIQAKGSQQAYQDAVKRFQTDRQAAGQAGAQLATMAPQQFKAQLGELGAIQTVGEQKQRQQQTALDEAFRQYQLERNYPYDTMSRYQSVVTGAPIATTQFADPTPPPPSTAQTLISGLGTLGATYGAFTGQNPLSLLTGRKHGGGLSDIPVVNADNGGYFKKLLDRYRFSNRAADAFPMENRGEGASMFPITKGVPLEIGTETYNKVLEDIKRARIAPEDRNTVPPLQAFDSSQAGDRSMLMPTSLFGRDDFQKVAQDVPEGTYGKDDRVYYTADEKEFYDAEGPSSKAQSDPKIPMIGKIDNIDFPLPNPKIKNTPSKKGLESLTPNIPQLDTAGMSEQIAIQQKEDAIRKALATQGDRYDERLKGIEDERIKGQYANLASFFARMGTATPTKGGLLGVVDAALQVAPESIDAMQSTNKEMRDRKENLEDKREDIKLLAMKEDLGMTLNKRDRKLKAEAVKFEKDKWKDQLKIYKEQNEIARVEANIPDDVKDVYINNLSDYTEGLLGTITNFTGNDFLIMDGKITGKRGPAILSQIESAKNEAISELVKLGGRYDAFVDAGGLNRLQNSINEIIGIETVIQKNDKDPNYDGNIS
jgi:hypothetical protein